MTKKRRLAARVLAVVPFLLAACGSGTPIDVDVSGARPAVEVVVASPPRVDWRQVGLDVRAVLDARWYTWAAQLSAPVVPSTRRPRGRSGGTHKGYATARDCVRATENGGDYGRSSNPTHFGVGQWDRGTWESDGGDPSTWGSASPEEQDRVFENGWSKGEAAQRQKWLKWDGCG